MYESVKAFGPNQAVDQNGNPKNTNIASKIEVELHVNF